MTRKITIAPTVAEHVAGPDHYILTIEADGEKMGGSALLSGDDLTRLMLAAGFTLQLRASSRVRSEGES